MDKLDRDVINELSAPAKRVFFLLDRNSQKRMLQQAREIAKQSVKKKKQKERLRQKSIRRNETKKKLGKKKQGISSGQACRTRNVSSHISSGLKEIIITSMHAFLIGENSSEELYQQNKEGAGAKDTDTFIVPQKIVRKTMKWSGGELRKNVQRERLKRKAQKKAVKASEKSIKVVMKGVQKAVMAAQKIVVSAVQVIASNPIVWIILLVVILIAVIAGVIGLVVGSGGAANSIDTSTYQAQVSEKTEGYRGLVEKYCEKYDIDDYVDLCLAMIEQESGGNPPDVMQTEQSYYNTDPPIDTPEESIDCGVHELSDCLTKANCKNSSDIPAISLALQGYNFGNGYIVWALKNYNGYSKDNAKVFSIKMCNELGYKSYGDIEYVSHVLRYYAANPDTIIANAATQDILNELKDNNAASNDVWKVIEKGASLIGTVQYSMEKRESDGRNNPNYLDCSSFAAWAFHKSGYTGIAYSSNTGTFISSGKFIDIEPKQLQPGDIGLKSKTGGTGGANHIGIYCGTLKNGTRVWLHCTSSSGSSLTGNESGAMFGAYTNFTYFRRLKKWNK